MAKYRKRPITVEARQFFHGAPMLIGVSYEADPEGKGLGRAYVITMHGQRAYLADGDWVITEPDGVHFYPCKPDVFTATYEPVIE